jgi:RNA polymerase sigma factor (sigma-70 family)
MFLRLSRSRSFEKARNPEAYLWRSTINLAFEWRRKQKGDVSLAEEAILPANDAPSALERIVRQEELTQLLDATARLKELDRQVVVLRYIEQKSYEEISKLTGKKQSPIKRGDLL